MECFVFVFFLSNMNVSFLRIESSVLNKFQNFESTILLSFNSCYWQQYGACSFIGDLFFFLYLYKNWKSQRVRHISHGCNSSSLECWGWSSRPTWVYSKTLTSPFPIKKKKKVGVVGWNWNRTTFTIVIVFF